MTTRKLTEIWFFFFFTYILFGLYPEWILKYKYIAVNGLRDYTVNINILLIIKIKRDETNQIYVINKKLYNKNLFKGIILFNPTFIILY